MSTATELLRRALEAHDQRFTLTNGAEQYQSVIAEIRVFLEAEPEAEPFGRLEADLSPPSGKGPFTNVDDLMKALRKDNEKEAEPVACVNTPLSMVYPEYNRHVLGARPEPSKKPMTEEEIKAGHKDSNCYVLSCIDPLCNFSSGVRWAEKHHGIGGDDGNHK